MNKTIKSLLSLMLLLAMALCALPARAEEALMPLADQFLYEPDEGEENAEVTPRRPTPPIGRKSLRWRGIRMWFAKAKPCASKSGRRWPWMILRR